MNIVKKILINGLGFTLITVGVAYYFFQVQAKDQTTAISHEGHNHGGHSAHGALARDPNRLWCGEHNVYEDECVICHPEIAGTVHEQDDHDHGHESDGHMETEEGLFCSTHRVLEIQCGICQPQLAAQLQPGEGMMVRLGSPDSVRKAGIQTGYPQIGAVDQSQEFLCEVIFNQNRFAHISPPAAGIIQHVPVNLGDHVEEGQVLAEIASNEVAKAKSDYLKALDQERLKKLIFQREKELVDKNITARQEFQQAEAEYQIAKTETMTTRQQLLNYGLRPDDVKTIEETRSSASLLKIRSPFSGTLVEKHAVMGEAIDVGESIFQLADLSTFWLELSIPETQITQIRVGDSIRSAFTAIPGYRIEGTITWLSPRIEENTRMMKARALVSNHDGKLRQGLFGKVRLVSPAKEERLVTPRDAVQTVDGKPFIFVKRENDLFEIRHIAPGRKSRDRIEILEGLTPRDEIVIVGSFTMKSEFLKSRFGAGCAHD
jgi:cobalt-zinc-cadmium efflux system membrane fusion protein